REEFAAEEPGEDADGPEMAWARAPPAGAVGRQAAAGDDAVDVGVELEVAGPGMEDHGDAEAGAEPSRVVAQREERAPGSAEQEGEEAPAVAEDEGAQRGGQREDDMEVRRREELRDPGVEPARFAQGFALGAMPVA